MLAACLFAWLAPAALAAEASYCVTCKNPDQTYRCRVTNEGPNPKTADALKLYCIIRTAQEGNHSSCSAERKTAGCGGVEKVYSYDGPAMQEQIASDRRVRNLMDQVKREQENFAKPKGTAPNTMVELGGRAVSASRQGWQNARSRLGGSSSTSQSAPSPIAEPLPSSATPASAPQAAPPPASTPPPAEIASPAPPSESRMKRASSAVGGFARKSYRCMLSFFRSCSEETAQSLQ